MFKLDTWTISSRTKGTIADLPDNRSKIMTRGGTPSCSGEEIVIVVEDQPAVLRADKKDEVYNHDLQDRWEKERLVMSIISAFSITGIVATVVLSIGPVNPGNTVTIPALVAGSLSATFLLASVIGTVYWCRKPLPPVPAGRCNEEAGATPSHVMTLPSDGHNEDKTLLEKNSIKQYGVEGAQNCLALMTLLGGGVLVFTILVITGPLNPEHTVTIPTIVAGTISATLLLASIIGAIYLCSKPLPAASANRLDEGVPSASVNERISRVEQWRSSCS